MQNIILHRTFLNKPQNGINSLLVILILGWGLSVTINPAVLHFLPDSLSVLNALRLLIGIVVPELISLMVLMRIINAYHQFIRAKELSLSFKSITIYELKFLPLFLCAFFLFFPLTLHIRFLLREFPIYSFHKYYDIYLVHGFTFNTYFLYLPFVVVLGYVLLNYSIVVDYSINKNHAIPTQTDALIETTTTTDSISYLEQIEVKTERFNVETSILLKDCHYFLMTDKRYYIVNHIDGTFKITKPIAVLEKGLSPQLFFRCNRQTIININYIGSFVHIDKGAYLIKMNTDTPTEFSITRERMKELKQLLQETQIV